MTVRCKFTCYEVARQVGQATVKLRAVTSGSDENKAFWKYTPAGDLVFQCLNEEAAKQFEPGKDFYIDITMAGA